MATFQLNSQGLLFRQRGINGNVNRAQQQAGKIGHRPLWTVLAEDGDAITPADTPCGERSRCPNHVAVKLARGDGDPLDSLLVQHDPVLVALDYGAKDVVDGLVHSRSVLPLNSSPHPR